MARKAHLYPPPNTRRDWGGQRRQDWVSARPPDRCGTCQAARVARHVGNLHPLGYVLSILSLGLFLPHFTSLWAMDGLLIIRVCRLCAHWWGWWLWWLVLPLPRFPLRYLWPYKAWSCTTQPWDSRIRVCSFTPFNAGPKLINISFSLISFPEEGKLVIG